MANVLRTIYWIGPGDLQSLISIASCRTPEYNFVRFWHPDVERRLGDARTVPVAIEMFAQWTARSEKPPRRLHQYDLLFTFEQLGGMEGVGRWMDVAEQHRGGLGRVMGSNYAREMFVSDRLLNCAAGLEAFDRESTGYAASKFKTRLRRCIALAGAPFSSLVRDVGSWAEAVRLERDDVAHHFGRRMASTGSETLYLWRSLYYLFVMCMLRTCGATDDLFAHLQKHAEYRWLLPRIQSAI